MTTTLDDVLPCPVLRPGDAGFSEEVTGFNLAHPHEPDAVIAATCAADVVTAVRWAARQGMPIAVQATGHGANAPMDGGLLISTRRMNQVSIDLEARTATVGAGATWQDVLRVAGPHGLAGLCGSSSGVGVVGYTVGGGLPVLGRAFGWAAQRVRGMEVVTADGEQRSVDAHHEPDLFWALRGGGGGHLGVVTSFTMSTFAAPTITRAFLAWPFSAAGEVVPRWLATAPTADRRLWSTLKLLGGATHPGGPALFMSATWTGTPSAIDTALRPFLSQVPTPTTDSRHTDSYRDTMLAYAGCSTIPVGACHTGPGGSLQREAFAATSHIVGAGHVDLSALLSRVHAAQGSGLKEAGISLDALGGAVDDLGSGATAFGHRGALATVQYTATYTSGPPTPALGYVRAFRKAMTPSWGHGAYVNYADASLADYQRAYFGANAGRLADARTTYDPQHVFTQPQD
jgi:FAD/FMN-containing dehydrogenase